MRNKLRLALPEKACKKHPTKSFLTSINPMYVIERLNDVFGVGSWHVKNDVILSDINQGSIVVKVTLEIPEYNIYLEQFGGNDNGGKDKKGFDLGDCFKGACTDGLTKLASYLEIGISIYQNQGNISNFVLDEEIEIENKRIALEKKETERIERERIALERKEQERIALEKKEAEEKLLSEQEILKKQKDFLIKLEGKLIAFKVTQPSLVKYHEYIKVNFTDKYKWLLENKQYNYIVEKYKPEPQVLENLAKQSVNKFDKCNTCSNETEFCICDIDKKAPVLEKV
jgi:hypothetical protein